MPDKSEIGWKEWVALPSLGVPAIKAKVDTGARTSTLHAFYVEEYGANGNNYVRFRIHPLRNRDDIELVCEAPIVDKRVVRDSGGHEEERYVISSDISLGDRTWPIEITLTNRDDMLFRMLLGRMAMIEGSLLIDPAKAYLHGKSLRSVYRKKRLRKAGE